MRQFVALPAKNQNASFDLCKPFANDGLRAVMASDHKVIMKNTLIIVQYDLEYFFKKDWIERAWLELEPKLASKALEEMHHTMYISCTALFKMYLLIVMCACE